MFKPKEHSAQFLLSEDFLNILNVIANFENTSRARVVERAFLFERYRGKHGNSKAWQKSAKAFKGQKKGKKIYIKRNGFAANKKPCKTREHNTESLF